MTLSGIERTEVLTGLARAKSKPLVTKTVSSALESELVEDGWTVLRRNARTIRVSKPKSIGVALEDRVWTLLFRMGFEWLSGPSGAELVINPKDPKSPVSRLDVVAVDPEVAIAIECKSAESRRTRPQFQEELGKHELARKPFSLSVTKEYQSPVKRASAMAMFVSNAALSDNDRRRAVEVNVTLFDEHDLAYYESLVAHLGPAAKYQFLADLLPGKSIPGLELRVPAIRTKMGGYFCYTFSVAPSYLLKIAFVSHRAKGRASDVDTYQRMIRKSRLRKIQEYISADGVFPTNIVVSLEKHPTFDQIESEGESKSGRLGWLTLRPAFKSAWIIDAAHRLFAYSGHERAETSHLAILAFDGLPPDKQAELFIDINDQQKSVKQSLLQELYAELHWNAEDPQARLRAIVSKAVQGLNDDASSPFYGRILAADEQRDALRCISLGNMFKSLLRPELYIAPARKNGPIEYGPLWAGDDQGATRDRTTRVLNGWFQALVKKVPEWWAAGSGEGGGFAMNDGVAACIDVMRSVLVHLDSTRHRLTRLDDGELVEALDPFADALGDYLLSMDEDARKRFRDLRGVQGVTTRVRRSQEFLKERFPDFDPPGLNEFLELEKAQTNQRAKEVVDRIEMTLQRAVMEELRREFSESDEQWWFEGIPLSVRKPVSARSEEDSGRRGGREFYFDLIDYRSIITDNWQLLGELFGFTGAGNGKEKRTVWLSEVNDVRKIVSHASSGRSVSLEQLDMLQRYDSWLHKQLVSASESVDLEA